jgi:hypothetical protein
MEIIKQIYFDEDNGRLMLSDSDNNHYLCNIYGDKLTEFIHGVSGIVSQKERGLSLIDKYNISRKQYLPSIRFFEGYTHFPRPKVPPFDNIKNDNKAKIIRLLKEKFKCEKVLELFNVKTNIGLPYLSGKLVNDESKKNRHRLIKIIDDYFEKYRVINKYKLNLMPKDPVIKALRRFKKLLLENIDINIIHCRTLNQPSDYVKKKYKEISNILNKKKKKNEKQIDYNTCLTKESIKDEMSFLSHESVNNKLYEQENIILVKDNNFFKKSLENEKKYLEGFKPPIRKKEGVVHHFEKPKYKTNGELYLEDLELFKKGIYS